MFLLFMGVSLPARGGVDQEDYIGYEERAGAGAKPGSIARGPASFSEAELNGYADGIMEPLRASAVPAAGSAGRRRTAAGLSAPLVAIRGEDNVLFSRAWKCNITSTVFWIGEKSTGVSPSNERSAWDSLWMAHYGGYDTPEETERTPWYTPISFRPQLNPFYVALPYCDLLNGKLRPEASAVIPWFSAGYRGSGISVCKDRWIAIYAHGRIAFAQWEDVGPFETDDWAYVFGPLPAPRHGFHQNAGIDVSPAVRSYLGLSGVDKVNWRFVEVSQVGTGPWQGWPDSFNAVSTVSSAGW